LAEAQVQHLNLGLVVIVSRTEQALSQPRNHALVVQRCFWQ